ncbi:phosphatidylglycerophosphatase A [Alphaproteobacteria bacterium]|nr:phosphatidylglycerophosphatase A [Alphaproteobacteria bacterium]
MKKSIHSILSTIATLGPIGNSMPAPGTAGSLVAVLCGYFLISLGWLQFLIITIAITIIGVFAANIYSTLTNTHDSGKMIIDEVAGQWVCLLFIPYEISYFIAAFFLFRLFDITKCWPVNKAEKLPDGVGVMADDIVAGLITGIILFVVNHYIVILKIPG